MTEEQQEYDESKFDFVVRFSSLWTDGQAIVAEGEGYGAISYPWALNEYEAALDLSPTEIWLLVQMIGHVWERNRRSYFSMARVVKSSKISRTTLDKVLSELKNKGYIHCEGSRGRFDRRNIYDISGVYLALDYAIKCNPDGKWAGANKGALTMADLFTNPPKEFANFTTPAQVNEYYHAQGKYFNWCMARTEELDTEGKAPRYYRVCEACEQGFHTDAHNAKRCPSCRVNHEQYRLQSFIESRAGNAAST